MSIVTGTVLNVQCTSCICSTLSGTCYRLLSYNVGNAYTAASTRTAFAIALHYTPTHLHTYLHIVCNGFFPFLLNFYSEFLQFIIRHYGRALLYGNKYIYQCMPRMLTLWLDFGSVVSDSGELRIVWAIPDNI